MMFTCGVPSSMMYIHYCVWLASLVTLAAVCEAVARASAAHQRVTRWCFP